MTREKILALYAAAVESAEWPDGRQDYYDKEREHEIRIKEAFFNAAQQEAFEQMVVKCKSMLIEYEADHSEGATYSATINDCIDAIREMANEMK